LDFCDFVLAVAVNSDLGSKKIEVWTYFRDNQDNTNSPKTDTTAFRAERLYVYSPLCRLYSLWIMLFEIKLMLCYNKSYRAPDKLIYKTTTPPFSPWLHWEKRSSLEECRLSSSDSRRTVIKPAWISCSDA